MIVFIIILASVYGCSKFNLEIIISKQVLLVIDLQTEQGEAMMTSTFSCTHSCTEYPAACASSQFSTNQTYLQISDCLCKSASINNDKSLTNQK